MAGLRMHPREKRVEEAKHQLRTVAHSICEAHDLTEGEYLRVLVDVLGESIGTIAKYRIRRERHRSIKKPGGLA